MPINFIIPFDIFDFQIRHYYKRYMESTGKAKEFAKQQLILLTQ